MRILAVLQCAWYKDGNSRRFMRWQRDLWHSHTGRRLLEMIPEQSIVFPINASPKTGDHAHSVFPPDPFHIQRAYQFYQPDVVLACGKIAQDGCRIAGLDYVAVPHPAWRQLSKEDTKRIREQLEALRWKNYHQV